MATEEQKLEQLKSIAESLALLAKTQQNMVNEIRALKTEIIGVKEEIRKHA